MESFKKVLPYILIAVVFAVGGYFIGRGNLSNQQAALFNKGTASYRSWYCQKPENRNKPECSQVSLAADTPDMDFAGILFYSEWSNCNGEGVKIGWSQSKGLWVCESLKTVVPDVMLPVPTGEVKANATIK